VENLAATVQPHATKRAFKKRSILLYQGEVPRMAYVVRSGLIKMYSINNAGEEQVVSFMGPNDIFSGPWIFNKASAALYYYETLTDSEILTLPRDILRDVLNRPEFLSKALDYYVSNYTGLLLRVTALEQPRARDKIMCTLYYLTYRYGREAKSGMYALNFPLTHKIIASLVGLARETISAEISKLKRQQVLAQQGDTYTINKQKLEMLLGEDSFQNFNF
jgi:CRP-like cAMP-binding protein